MGAFRNPGVDDLVAIIYIYCRGITEYQHCSVMVLSFSFWVSELRVKGFWV